MLTEYIEAAMRKAKYEFLDGGEGFCGTIPGFRGVLGNALTLEACREDLKGALETWIVIKLQHNHNNLPVINSINLNAKRKRKAVA